MDFGNGVSISGFYFEQFDSNSAPRDKWYNFRDLISLILYHVMYPHYIDIVEINRLFEVNLEMERGFLDLFWAIYHTLRVSRSKCFVICIS